ncbi:copper chaperone PCu(A)C [Kocuria sp.]|uniref:copper chaperone PCu(A)C n=1 Tax=Kocuria sp. TaxID=1871328 RepID=UPI0028AD8997|nr:copper chaperone PCu(A)C [Kocuria sp.]
MNYNLNTTSVPAPRRALAAVAVLGPGLATLSGCSAQGGEAASPAGTDSATHSTAAVPLELSDGWAKAADSGMTAVFGKLTNISGQEVTFTGAGADGVARSVELHETVADGGSGATQMRQMEGGFTLAPGESLDLKPGGNHIMLMGLTCSLKAGSDLTLQLRTDSGARDVTVPVRDFTGAKERYALGEDEHSGHGDEHATHGGEHRSGAAHASSSDAAHDHGSHEGMSTSPSSSALPTCHDH